MKNSWNSIFLQTLFILLWSSGSIVITIGLRYTNPFTFLFYRLSIATLFMLIISLLVKAPWPKNWNVLWKIASVGLLIQFSYITTYFCALYYGVSPTVMTIILALQPTFVALILNLFLKHTSNKYQYLGLLIGLAGVCITVIYDFNLHRVSVIGLAFATLCVVSISVGSVIQKNNPVMDLRTGSAIQSAVSWIPLTIINYFYGSFSFPLHFTFICALIWMAIVLSVGATCLYYKLMKDGSAVAINSLFYIVPALTAVLCYFVFGTIITIYTILGIIFVLIGVYLVQRNAI